MYRLFIPRTNSTQQPPTSASKWLQLPFVESAAKGVHAEKKIKKIAKTSSQVVESAAKGV